MVEVVCNSLGTGKQKERARHKYDESIKHFNGWDLMESEYFKLLLKYHNLPKSGRLSNIFDISGYPHYERVCSNVLAFYLNPLEEHGLGNLVLSELLEIAGYPLDKTIKRINVKRESPTILGGFLDLLIISEDVVLGIENKIFHHLNNDLVDYKNTIDNIAIQQQLTPIYIVLSLNPIVISIDIGFINITYKTLWNRVKSKLGYYSSTATLKWLMYLVDFMDSTELLGGDCMKFTDRDHFFIENDEVVEKLVKDRDFFLGRLNAQITALKDIIENAEDTPKQIERRWIYASSCLVHDYILSGKKIAFDLYITPKGWILHAFGRNQSSSNYLNQLIASRRDKITMDGDRFVIAQRPLSTGLDEIKNELCSWMAWIIQQDANNLLQQNSI